MTYYVTKTETCLNCQGKGHIIIPDMSATPRSYSRRHPSSWNLPSAAFAFGRYYKWPVVES